MKTKFKPKFNTNQYVIESATKSGLDDNKTIDNILKAWEYIKDKKKLKNRDIKEIHKIVLQNMGNQSTAGLYRSETKSNDIDLVFSFPQYFSFAKNDERIIKQTLIAEIDYEEVNKEMEMFLKDLGKMTPLIAHVRFMYIHPFNIHSGIVGRLIYWWDCLKIGKLPFRYKVDKRVNYYQLFDPRRIESMKNSKWGLRSNKPKYEAIIKLKNGKLVRGAFMEKPTEKIVKQNLPKELKLDSIIKIKKL